jgi:hypothetical protein
VATSLGCLPSAIDDEPAVNIFGLLDYWKEEPPTHVILAMRYLGPSSKGGKKRISEEDARKDMGEMSALLGPARPLPPNLKEMIARAEALKKQHKGI